MCPKLVLKIARLDSSFARYTSTFRVTLLASIVIRVSLWLFPSCMRVFIASTMSVMEVVQGGADQKEVVGDPPCNEIVYSSRLAPGAERGPRSCIKIRYSFGNG